MHVQDFIARLDGVRKGSVRDAWVAKCPAHADRSPSLTVRGMPDGRILLHCFAGCETWDVLLSMGLQFRDVMPERLGEFRRERPAFSAHDALKALASESAIVALCASELAEGRELSAEDTQRTRLATGRIADALEFIHGR